MLPGLQDGQVVIAQSNNAWDMDGDSFANASLYRIDVRAVDVPGVPGVPAVEPAAGPVVRPPATPARTAMLDGPTDVGPVAPPLRSLDASGLVVTPSAPPPGG